MDNKRFIYIPSFSVGALASNATKGSKLNGEIDAKFWDKDFNKEFHYPYFLLTAGHFYKKMDTRDKFGLQDSFVFGDSGGYQIITGAIKFDSIESIRKQIFEWLEANSDVAMNIDFPPRGTYEGKFKEALEKSIENFEWFEKNQTGKTKFLNVLQGNNYDEYNTWYQAVKHFDFKGWGLGGASTSIIKFFASLAVLIENKEHLKDNIEFIHYLGASSPTYFFMLSQLQKSLVEVGSKSLVMSDSSTPNIMSKFGMYTVAYDLKRLNVTNINLPKKPENKEDYEGYPLPTTCSYDNWLNQHTDFGQMVDFENVQYIGFVQHNLYMLLKMKEEIDYYVNGPKFILEQITTKDMVSINDVIDKMVKSDNPYLVMEKYMPLIEKVSRSTHYESEGKMIDMSESKFFKKV